MEFFGFSITRQGPVRSRKNNLSSYQTTSSRISLSDLVKNGDHIKISKDVFYELYIRNGDIRACIRDIAKRVGVKGIYLEKDGAVYDKAVLKTSISDVFKYPTFMDFKVELFKHLMVSGEVYIVPVYNGLNKVVGFRFLDPRTMQKYANKATGEIVFFTQKIPGTKEERFSLDEISYFQFEMNPNNNYDGLSILEGVVYDALTDKEAMVRNYQFFRNGMMPDGIIMLDPEFDPDELEIAKEKLKTELQGTENAHKMLITNTVKDVKALSLTSRDLDFINQRKLTTEKVCAAIGVPKFIIGYTEGVQRSNGDASYNQYIDGTIKTSQEYAEYIVNVLYGKFIDKEFSSGTITIRLDGEKIDDRKAIETAQREDIKSGVISLDEARTERGLKPWSLKGLTDVPLMASTV